MLIVEKIMVRRKPLVAAAAVALLFCVVGHQAVNANGRKPTILVTGGAGYVGSFTVQALCEEQYQVVVVDNLESGHMEAVEGGCAKLVQLDLANRTELFELFKRVKPTAVIDFAAYLDVGESQFKPGKYYSNNVANFLNVLDAMASVNCKYIIKSSTQATYGDAPQELMPLKESYSKTAQFPHSQLAEGYWDGERLTGLQLFDKFMGKVKALIQPVEYLDFTPNDMITLNTPKSIYGLSKLLDEVLLQKYSTQYGINWISLRYGNVCGAHPDGSIGEAKPRPHTLMTLAIYSLLGRAQKLKVYGTDYPTADGTTIRDYVHPQDLAQGHIAALQWLLQGKPSEVFNLGTGKGSSVFDVLREVEKVSEKKLEYEVQGRRLGDSVSAYLSIEKANRLLGYKPKHDLHSMAQTAWKWHTLYQDVNGYRKR